MLFDIWHGFIQIDLGEGQLRLKYIKTSSDAHCADVPASWKHLHCEVIHIDCFNSIRCIWDPHGQMTASMADLEL